MNDYYPALRANDELITGATRIEFERSRTNDPERTGKRIAN